MVSCDLVFGVKILNYLQLKNNFSDEVDKMRCCVNCLPRTCWISNKLCYSNLGKFNHLAKGIHCSKNAFIVSAEWVR